MKKLLTLSLLIFAASYGRCDSHIWRSSATATADSKPLCVGRQRGILHSIVVSSASAASDITVFNSTFTTTSVQNTGTIMTATVGAFPFDLGYPSGLLYTKTGPAAVVILYDCY